MKPLKYLLTACVLLGLLSGCTKEPADPGELSDMTGITVLDGAGQTMIAEATAKDLSEDTRWAYLEQAVYEAARILAEQNSCTWEEAQLQLFSGGYILHTAFDTEAFQAMEQTLSVDSIGAIPAGGAITDLEGRLLAMYSARIDETNYANAALDPCSAFKPLSVYAPALEAGTIQWSSLYEDSPYKQLEGKDWPQNATGTYSQREVTVSEAIRSSLNSVAVKCLADLGVENSIAFLQENFEIPLLREQETAQKQGPEEVIGNIALGSLETGVSAVDMAGYYQIFANGGVYQKPASVMKVTDKKGNLLYERKTEAKQVLGAENADIMNKLLQGVVVAGGTGKDAYCKDVEVAGKTGTGEDNAGNWFVGVTPGYSCAIWHGQDTKNRAASLFSQVIEAFYSNKPQTGRKFITHKNLREIVFCTESGKAISDDCTKIDIGYFTRETALPICEKHGSNEKGDDVNEGF